MKRHLEAVEVAEAEGRTGDRGAWKWAIRKRVWDYMEEHDIAAPPRPVHHRIPNFVGAELTARQVEQLPEFQRARVVKVNPDTPQAPVRLATLRAGKLLLVPQPRLRTGFFSVLDPSKIHPSKFGFAATQAGVAELGSPIELDAELKVDLIVVGSVAVNPANGARIGKGEGFAELEYGILRLMGAIDDDTPVVTCIHDCQLVDDIPSEKMLCHDVPVDIICTPTQTIRVNRVLPKPTGIYWDKLSPQKLASICILQRLKAKLERETGEALPTGPDEILPPTAHRGDKGKGKGKAGGKNAGKGDKDGGKGVKAGGKAHAEGGSKGGQASGGKGGGPALERQNRWGGARSEWSAGGGSGSAEAPRVRRWVPKQGGTATA